MGQAATRPQDLRLLTMLRFFAALWVVLYHYWPSLGVERPALVARGYLGLEVFFVLSGFILAHVYLEPFGRRRYVSFLWAAAALHHGVERPARDLMRRLGPPGSHGRDRARRRPGLVEPEYIPAPSRNREK